MNDVVDFLDYRSGTCGHYFILGSSRLKPEIVPGKFDNCPAPSFAMIGRSGFL